MKRCVFAMETGIAIVALLRACAKQKDLDKGIGVHAVVLKKGLFGWNPYVSNTLVSLYAKCGVLVKAQQILEELPIQTVVSWSALIAGYAQQGKGQDALDCFHRMQHEGLSPDTVTFISVLKACGAMGATEKGEHIHYEIVKRRLLQHDVALGNALVTMYAKCGALAKAQKVLNELPLRDVVSWSALIAGYAQHGEGHNALNCLERMQREGLSPNSVTFVSLLKACGSIGAIDVGEQVHEEISRQKLLGKDSVLGNVLVDMYARCGALTKARRVFEGLPNRDVVSWSVLIAGYAQQGQGQDALKCYEQMRRNGVSPNAVTFLSVLKACGSIGALEKGEQIHDEIKEQDLLGKESALGNALVDMYAKCGALAKAAQVLDELPARDIVSWSSLIAGYVLHEQIQDALSCFEKLQQEGLPPDAVTFTSILKGCGSTGRVDKGRKIHDEVVRHGLLENNILLGTALVDMYARCGALAKAQQVQKELQVLNVAPWNALIAGFVKQELGDEALICFREMLHSGLTPDEVTFSTILKASGSIGDSNRGEQIHNEIVRHGLSLNHAVLGTALVDMYAKCGALAKAQQLLEELPAGNVVSWSALIAGFAQQGHWESALKCFVCMQDKGLSPNRVTFSSMLNACSHSGLVDEGHMYLVSMSTIFGIIPDSEHYTCMVDLLGRAGHFEKAMAIIQRMPSFEYPAIWSALLGACRKWGDVNVGRWAFEQAIQTNDSDVLYLCMFNIYTAAGMKGDAADIESMRSLSKARKMHGLMKVRSVLEDIAAEV